MIEKAVTGAKPTPPRIILYGMEGIGKSTFGAGFPNPIFIQTEDGLGNIDCARLPLCTAYSDVLEQLVAVQVEQHEYKTVVIDSLDWLERLIWDKVCNDAKVDNIESLGYGRGYVLALSQWRRLLDVINRIHERGLIVLFTAHAVTEDYSDPEIANIKRFTPRLHKTARSLLSEYVDLILLATRKYGAAKGEQNNPRVVRTEASPVQVAKSRYAIPAELPLDARAVLNAISESVRYRLAQRGVYLAPQTESNKVEIVVPDYREEGRGYDPARVQEVIESKQ